MNRLAHGVASLGLLATALAAQSTGPGLTWAGTAGGSTGSFFPTCTALPVVALRGDPVTLRVWGDPGSLFVVLVAATATQCLPIPGVGNGLVLDLAAAPVLAGLLTQPTPCLACPPAFAPIAFVVPATLPLGSSVSFQAAGFGNNQFVLTTAITASIQ